MIWRKKIGRWVGVMWMGKYVVTGEEGVVGVYEGVKIEDVGMQLG